MMRSEKETERLAKMEELCRDKIMEAVENVITKGGRSDLGLDELQMACFALVRAHADFRALFDHTVNLQFPNAKDVNEAMATQDAAEADIKLTAMEESRSAAERMFR